ncbi:OsmC family protein [uncultured Cellulomonas sp.]|uniref:OsmC family protein n=1 Tax=uncultured Cellulomonas sp. TaxID=189682 RepID=UPI002614BC69|nr:OsmC family protein [uncultured Cellulomonas sp.]
MSTERGGRPPSVLESPDVPGAAPTDALTGPLTGTATGAVAGGPAELWVERTGTRTYTGYSSRGAQVSIGPVEAGAVFTPGELLKIALAGCTGMTSDAALARRLGDDVAVTVRVSSVAHPEEDRYTDLHEELVVDLSGLDDAARTRLLTVVQRSVEQSCTIANTLTRGARVHLNVVEEV